MRPPGPAWQAGDKAGLVWDRHQADSRRRRAGPRPRRGGTWAVCRLHHSGATLGLIAGELLAYEIITGASHPMLVDFNVRRFR